MTFEQMRIFFKKLDKDLQYPNCEGKSDEKRIIELAKIEFAKVNK